MNMDYLVENLIQDEGLGKPGAPGVAYKDSVGKLTVGAGRNLEDVGLTFQELADIILPEMTAKDLCERIAYTPEPGRWTRKQRIFFSTHHSFHTIIGKESLTEAEMRMLLEHDIKHSTRCAETLFGLEETAVEGDNAQETYWNDLPAEVQEVIVQVVFNLGLGGFSKFKKCIAALKQHNWRRAAEELLDSRAARQTGKRYHRYAETLRRVPIWVKVDLGTNRIVERLKRYPNAEELNDD